jgi:dynein assembly factor 1
LENLETLQLKRNRIGSHIDDLEGLLSAPSIETLDLSSNLIEKEDALQIFFEMPKIIILNLDNNEVKKKILHYRKHLIGKIPALVCLDDNPVFEDEKRYALAWKKGGI